jgi:hypothetical protein
MSDQNNTPPHPEGELKFQNASHDADDGKDEFCDGERV